ncbi:MAG TPA: zf-HC2 domain-containing protein [Acidimicrobiales bacterium]|jgi:anti-sigma factor RsiW
MSVRLLGNDILCRQAVALMTEYLEGTLPWRERRRLRRHLRRCPNCSEYLEQLRTTISLVGQVGPDHLPDQALAHLTDVFRRYRDLPPDQPDQ